MQDVPDGGVIDAKGEKRLRVKWPDMRMSNDTEALGQLRGAYKTILSEVKSQWVILEAVSPELFGANGAYSLTARALLGAILERTEPKSHPKVAFCVFANPTVVVSYDDAFYGELAADETGSEKSDGETSDYSDTDDGEDGSYQDIEALLNASLRSRA